MPKDNIILIGFMGTGKTTVGKIIAEKMQWTFLDTDDLIETRTGMSIPAIFEKYGEQWFRDQESAVIEEVLKEKNQVISTGGGAVLREENRQMMLEGGIVAALKADADTIVERVSRSEDRPLLRGEVRERVETLLAARKTAYDFAHVEFDAAALSPSQLAERIIQHFKSV